MVTHSFFLRGDKDDNVAYAQQVSIRLRGEADSVSVPSAVIDLCKRLMLCWTAPAREWEC